MTDLSLVEVSKEALRNNIRQIRKLVGEKVLICPCVKGNAYGHGLIETAKTFIDAGANWLSTNALFEAKKLRENGVNCPIYVMGYVPLADLKEVVDLDLRIVLYNLETAKKLNEAAKEKGRKAKVHLKIETGNNRQGILISDLVGFAKEILSFGGIEIEGISTHFANIEDTTDHSYAELQLKKFLEAYELLKENGISVPIRHCANSAATMLFPKTHLEMVRPGICAYGMWPSKETYLSYVKEVGGNLDIKPALSWKTKIAQIKTVPGGEYVGYGCTFKTSHETRLAILPIGYYDGYDRGINQGYVLIHGKRAPIRGRVCMNIIMVEITDIPEAKLEDEVTLIGKDGEENISAEQFAAWASTINYEITTRINERIERIFV